CGIRTCRSWMWLLALDSPPRATFRTGSSVTSGSRPQPTGSTNPDDGVRLLPSLHHDADIVGIDQVRRDPAVQIVFRHALLGEALVFRRLPCGVRRHEGFKPDALMIAKVVPLVKLVASAKLGPDRVP